MTETLTWLGIAFCLSQSASLSGLNLAVFSLSRLRLEAQAGAGHRAAGRVLALRRDANFTLVTILWGNVAMNVLLTLLAESVLAGVAAFLFSTVAITFVGEIIPQAYFTRHALRVVALLYPLLRLYQLLLWPIARPVGRLLDRVVGPEGVPWFREAELRQVLRHHARSADNEVDRIEAIGAINFLALDDIPAGDEGERLDPDSVIALPHRDGRPVTPDFTRAPDDPFIARLQASGRRWVVITDEADEPRHVLDAHAFLRDALFAGDDFDPAARFRRPIVLPDPGTPLGQALGRLRTLAERPDDDLLDTGLILVWAPHHRRLITGSDLLGRLLRGIAREPGGRA